MMHKLTQFILIGLTLLFMAYSLIHGQVMQSGFQLMVGGSIVLLIQRYFELKQFKQNQNRHD